MYLKYKNVKKRTGGIIKIPNPIKNETVITINNPKIPLILFTS
jgi:hypothetical protein